MTENINLNKIDNVVESFLNDKYVSTAIILFITLYASLAAPKLPKSWLNMLDSQISKLLMLFMIGYLSTKNFPVAIISAMAFLLTMNTIQKHQVNDKIINIIVVDAIDSNLNEVIQQNTNEYNKEYTNEYTNKYTNEHTNEDTNEYTNINQIQPPVNIQIPDKEPIQMVSALNEDNQEMPINIISIPEKKHVTFKESANSVQFIEKFDNISTKISGFDRGDDNLSRF